MPSISNAETLLAIDVGSVNTRASLFDVVDGNFRLLASARVPTTARYPLLDFGEGVRVAIERVQDITGRKLLDESELLIMPSTGFGTGIDLCVGTASAGPVLRTLLVGLMPGVSVASLRRLASSMMMDVVGVLHLSDRRQDHERIQMIVDANADILIVAGGTDGGASGPLLEMIDLIGMAVERLPQEKRPVLIFCGNRHLGATIVERMVERTQVILATNVRPGIEKEDLTSTRIRTAEALAATRYQHINGYEELRQWTGGHLLPSAEAFSRVIRYLSAVVDSDNGVLGVDLGANQVTMAVGTYSDFNLHVRPDLGLGEPLAQFEDHIDPEKVIRWLPFEYETEALRNYLQNKALYPSSIPVTAEELYIELALAREILHFTMMQACRDWGDGIRILKHGVLAPKELILAGGAALSRTPDPALTLLAVLDGLQPTGMTTLLMDPYNLTPSLGMMAEVLPVGTVQVLESSSLPRLATVLAPLPPSSSHRSILHIRLDSIDGGHILETTVQGGDLELIPFTPGMEGSLVLRPDRNMDLGFGGPGKAGIVQVQGSILGIVIDLRGRPLKMPEDFASCSALNQAWLEKAGVSLDSGTALAT
ncbi:MAG: glutamate mutase L [Anaerolineales bacterium]|nr:glutamate mutase L [Anaerolineales bacterium]